MIISVSFLRPITCEIAPGGLDTWSAKDHGEKGIECIDKGTHMLITWAGKSPTFKGKRCRIKVPLTNIAQLFEVEDEPKVEKKP